MESPQLPSQRSPQRPLTDEERRVAETVIDPVAFAVHWLGQRIWGLQARIMRSVAQRSRTSVKSCHGSGKTFAAACLALWWMTRYPDGIVITTAPGWDQVERVIWRPIHTLIEGARVKFPEPNVTELYRSSANYIVGLSPREGVRFQGFHGRVLIIIDEAMGIESEVHEAIEGIRAGGDVRLLELGNPTVASGPFYDHHSSERQIWGSGLFTISAFDTPNLEGLDLATLLTMSEDERGRAEWPQLITREWVYEKFFKWGGTLTRDEHGEVLIFEPTHHEWESRVLGRFPRRGDNQLFALDQLEAAQQRPAVDRGAPLRAGVDVAGPGEDETTLCLADGDGNIIRQRWWPDADPRGALVAELLPVKDRLEVVNVDAVGIGYYLGKHLEDQGFPVQLVNVGKPARQKRRYANLKAELYWGLRMRLAAGDLHGLQDNATVSQLQSVLYKQNPRGQIEIESKADARKRGVKSPDRAESIVLAFADAMGTIDLGMPPDPRENAEKGEYQKQLEEALPAVAAVANYRAEKQATCVSCVALRRVPRQDLVGHCEVQGFKTPLDAPQCPHYWPRDEE